MHYFFIPFRDRVDVLDECLLGLKSSIIDYNYRLIVVEPKHDGRYFNLGASCNVAFKLFSDSCNLSKDDEFVFHPCDICCDNVNYNIPVGYNMMNYVDKSKIAYPKFWSFKVSLYKQFNGLSNKFFNWGREDDDMFRRANTAQASVWNQLCSFRHLNSNYITPLNLYKETAAGDRVYYYNWEVNDRYMSDGINSVDFKIIEKKSTCGVDHYVFELPK